MGHTAAEILDALGRLPDDVLLKHIPSFSPHEIREGLSIAARFLPRSIEKRSNPLPLFSESETGKKLKQNALFLFTDGASRGNPGDAGAGFVIVNEQGEELLAQGIYLGSCTNNVAEYKALIMGLSEATKLGCGSIFVSLDSQLIVRQVQGQYKVKSADLLPLYKKVRELLANLKNYTIKHIPREQNKRADQLANQGIDNRLGVGA